MTLRAASIAFYGALGSWAYDTFARLNDLYFEGALRPRPIVWGLTPHGGKLGLYSPGVGAITLHPSLVEPKSDDPWHLCEWRGITLRKLHTEDVLLHEMVHAAVHELRGGAGSHNDPGWCAEIERITPLLGLPPIKVKPVRQKRVDGKVVWYVEPGHLTRKELAGWPHSIRPVGYYSAET